ncbi:MAG: acyltransferase [Massilia sp.]
MSSNNIVTPAKNNNFNLLRLILASLVILSHAPEMVDGNRSRELLTSLFHTISFGEFAVDGFFLLSGYLIVQSWANTPDVFQFLRSRVLRIFPGFIVASLVCAFVVGPLAANAAGYFSRLSITGLIASLVLLQPPEVPPVFAGSFYPRINGAMWTISFEFMCYMVVLLAGIAGLVGRRRAWLAATIVLFAAFVAERFAVLPSLPSQLMWFDPLIRLGSFFLVGGACYLYREKISYSRPLAILALIVLALGMKSWRLSELVLATAGAYLMFFFAFKPIASLAKFNRLPDVSYGVYLYGWPVQKLLLWTFPQLSPWSLSFWSLLGALALGTVSWYLIEKPFLKFKRLPSPKAVDVRSVLTAE